MDSIIRILRNGTLWPSYDKAKEELVKILSSKSDGELALVTYGQSWDDSKTIFGVVRTVNGKNSTTIYEPFKNSMLKIADYEKVLSQDDNGLISTLSLAYGTHSDGTEGKKSIKLFGKDTQTPISEIDVADFIKDGMLSNAELVKEKEEGIDVEVPYIKLTFNTDADSKIVRFSVKDLVDVYTQGNGITISDKVVSVKVSDDSEYLSVDEGGVKVSGVNQAISDAVSGILKDYEKTTYSDPFEDKIKNAQLHVDGNDTVKVATKKLEGTISKLVDEVLDNEQTVAAGINDMANAAGVVEESGKIGYVVETDTNYIKDATSVHNATVILDSKLKEIANIVADNVIDGGTY